MHVNPPLAATLIETIYEAERDRQCTAEARKSAPERVMLCCRLLTVLALRPAEVERAKGAINSFLTSLPFQSRYKPAYMACAKAVATLDLASRTQVGPVRAIQLTAMELCDEYRAEMQSGRHNAVGVNHIYEPQFALVAELIGRAAFSDGELHTITDWVLDEAAHLPFAEAAFRANADARRHTSQLALARHNAPLVMPVYADGQ